MAATYEVWLTDSAGVTLDNIDDWLSLQFARAVNEVGTLSLVLDGNYDTSLLKLDGRIGIYRNGKLCTETVWLIREIIKQLDQEGRRTLQVVAYSANEIIKRRVVAYSAGTAQAAISDFADDAMKTIMRDNFGSSVSVAARSIATYLTIENDTSQGPTISKEMNYDNTFDAIRDISQATITAGSGVYFDIVAPTLSTLEFRTYRDWRGVDHRFPNGINPVVISPERGSLAGATKGYNYAGEVTYVFAQGQESVITASSNTRIGESVFNRREAFINVSGADDTTAGDEADAALRGGRPRRSFSGELVNIPDTTEFEVHWSLGDAVTVEFDGESIDCSIDAVSVSVEGKKETIGATLRALEE